MAQPGINAKIEELQFRLKTDPKSRLFFPLAEELRKFGKLSEAEQVLRTGLGVHATYLSAWVSLGRVLREQHKNADAVEALNTALRVDPGNVVAARLLGDAYLDLGEKVEAIKKYKLVHALMGSDEELEAKIESLDRDIQTSLPAPPAAAAPEPESPFAPEPESPFAAALEPEPPIDHSSPAPAPYERTIESPFTGDAVPATEQGGENPFDESSRGVAAAPEIEQPEAVHVEEAGVAEAPSPWIEERSEGPSENEPVADVFAPAEPDSPSLQPEDDVTATTTMGDLYVRQGLIDDARKIYEHVLQRDPSDDEARAKLDSLSASQPSAYDVPEERFVEEEPEPEAPAGHPKVVVLQRWLARVGRREEGHA
jgi:Putative Zn-dependent protease, contains TPR repeats